MKKLDAAAEPETVGGVDVFGDEGDLGGTSDQLVVRGAAFRREQSEYGAAIRRRDGDPTAKLEAAVGHYAESELLAIEFDAAAVIANEYVRFEQS